MVRGVAEMRWAVVSDGDCRGREWGTFETQILNELYET